MNDFDVSLDPDEALSAQIIREFIGNFEGIPGILNHIWGRYAISILTILVLTTLLASKWIAALKCLDMEPWRVAEIHDDIGYLWKKPNKNSKIL